MSTPSPSPNANANANANANDERLMRLEIQMSYADDLLDTLNALVAQQQDQIARLQQELRQLRQQRSEEPPGGPLHARDERPPHY